VCEFDDPYLVNINKNSDKIWCDVVIANTATN